MLDVPGSLEKYRLPKAVAVVQALNVTARVSTDCNNLGLPLAPGHDVINLESHADAEQERQCDDIGEVERQIDRTQISSVTTPATRSGMSVNNTSPSRRSVIHNSNAIDKSAQAPASRKAVMMVRRASRIEMGPSVALGSTFCTSARTSATSRCRSRCRSVRLRAALARPA
jgi:hypothetical protein